MKSNYRKNCLLQSFFVISHVGTDGVGSVNAEHSFIYYISINRYNTIEF